MFGALPTQTELEIAAAEREKAFRLLPSERQVGRVGALERLWQNAFTLPVVVGAAAFWFFVFRKR